MDGPGGSNGRSSFLKNFTGRSASERSRNSKMINVWRNFVTKIASIGDGSETDNFF